MIGEISVGGVYLPPILLLGVLATILTALATRVFGYVGVYRLVAYRPLVDLALFIFILGLLSLLTGPSS